MYLLCCNEFTIYSINFNTLYQQKQDLSIEINQLINQQNQKIIDYQINQYLLATLSQKSIHFYSAYQHTLIFSYHLQNLYKLNSNLTQVQYLRLNHVCMVISHKQSCNVSTFSISAHGAKYISTNSLELQNIYSIEKIFLNSYNSQITTVTKHKQFQLKRNKSKLYQDNQQFKQQQFLQYLQITTSHIAINSIRGFISKLKLKDKRFNKIITAPWLSQYIIQTDKQLVAQNWIINYDHIKCAKLHPTGLYLTIGFNDCFKIYIVTFQGIQNTFMGDSVKDCQSMAYSTLGNHLVVGSSNLICIYNSYSCQRIKTITLSMGVLIQELFFTKDSLYCLLKNKKIFLYSIYHDYKEIFTFNPKNHINQHQSDTCINSLYYDNKVGIIIVSYSKKLHFINCLNYESLGIYDYQNVTCIQYCQLLDTLFLGTQLGSIIAFPWPNNPINITTKLPTYKLHGSKVITIKITSDYKYLLSIGSDGSFYKSNIIYVDQMKKLKNYELIQQKKSHLSIICNLMKDKRVCQYTNCQWNHKLQYIKQLQQQVNNVNFIYPEQRHKQKQNLITSIKDKKIQLGDKNDRLNNQFTLQARSIKQKSFLIQKQRRNSENQYNDTKNTFIDDFQRQISKLAKQRQILQIQFNEEYQKINKENQYYKNQFQKQIKLAQKQYNQHLQNKHKQIGCFSQIFKSHENNMKQLFQIDEEKSIAKQIQVKQLDQQLEKIKSRNGLLQCRNSQIQKNINQLKNKIDDLKYLIYSATQSIKGIKKNTFKQNNQHIDKLYQVQKRYMNGTKQLIKMDKQITLNIYLYQKQKQILIILQKALQKTSNQIQKIVEDIFQQKQYKQVCQIKYKTSKNKYQYLFQKSKLLKLKKIKIKNQFNQLIHKIYQYLNNSSSLSELNKFTKISCKSERDNCQFNQNIRYTQMSVNKKIQKQKKILNFIKNQKKIYSRQKKKMNLHNQDLVDTINTLSFQNKYLINIMKTQDHNLLEKPIKDNKRKKVINPTPFQKYSKSRTMRRMKTSPDYPQ